MSTDEPTREVLLAAIREHAANWCDRASSRPPAALLHVAGDVSIRWVVHVCPSARAEGDHVEPQQDQTVHVM